MKSFQLLQTNLFFCYSLQGFENIGQDRVIWLCWLNFLVFGYFPYFHYRTFKLRFFIWAESVVPLRRCNTTDYSIKILSCTAWGESIGFYGISQEKFHTALLGIAPFSDVVDSANLGHNVSKKVTQHELLGMKK